MRDHGPIGWTWPALLAFVLTLGVVAGGCDESGTAAVPDPVGDDDAADDDDNDAADDDTTAADDDDTEIVPGGDDDDTGEASNDWLFTLDEVHDIAITLPADSEQALRQDPYTYVPGDVTVAGRAFIEVGVRLKGHLGSYRTLDQKAGFKVDLNYYSPQDLDGIERLSIHNLVQDTSCVHDLTAYTIYRAVGVPAPRVGYAWVTVNDEPFGLYGLVEQYDDEFLDQHYDDPDGNLYDGDYKLWPDGNYSLLDFDESTDGLFDLDEGTDVGLADIHGITVALATSCGSMDFWDTVGAVVDLEEYTHMWATEAWVGQYDGYAYNKNNFRVYFDPGDGGRADLFAWDHDWAFYDYTPVTSPQGLLAYCCKADSTCHARFLEAIDEISTYVEGSNLAEQAQQAADLIQPYLVDDPRREYTMSTVQWSQQELQHWLDERADELAHTNGL